MNLKKSKILITVFLSTIALLLCCFFANAYLLGDVDSDGKITAYDARTILRTAVALEHLSAEQEEIADVDFDLSITASDARIVLRTSVGLEEEIEIDIYEAPSVAYISNRSIQYDKSTNYFTFIFSFLDEYEFEVSAPATVFIRFENSEGEIVYQDERFVLPDDFGTWKNTYGYQYYAASINIYAEDILPSMNSNGTFYYQIVVSDECYFDEFSLSVYDLPEIDLTEQCSLICPSTPCSVSYYGYQETRTIQVNDIKYNFSENSDNTVSLEITISGERIDHDPISGDNTSEHCYVGYKILDSEGYVIETDEFFTPQLTNGEKFKNVSEYFWSLEPGEYTLQFIDVIW